MGASLKSRGFTLVELMVVLALISLIALMGTSAFSAYKRADVTLYLQQLYQLAEATHRLKEPLAKITTGGNLGGPMILNAAFPHGEVKRVSTSSNTYDTPLGSTMGVWYPYLADYAYFISFSLSQQECTEILTKVSMADFYQTYISGQIARYVSASSFPLSYSTADSYCTPSTWGTVNVYFFTYP